MFLTSKHTARGRSANFFKMECAKPWAKILLRRDHRRKRKNGGGSPEPIFVLPSRYGEGLPMAMLEAMAAGCVVVAADAGSVTAVVTDGENGYVVEPKNTAQLAEN